MCGSSQPAPSPTQSQTTTQDLPDWAKGYAQDTLAKGAALTDVNKNPYQPYGGQRIAGFTPLQQQAFQGAANLGPTAQTAMGSGLAAAAGAGALGQNYQAGRFSGGQFSPMAASQYMSPFVQQALEPQLREATRQSAIMGQQNAAQAAQRGAFGGSRSALMESERQRNLGTQLSDITGKGYQTAYEQAANQFNQDMARRMQAQQLGEQSRQFGANLGLQGLQTGLQAAGALGNLGAQQFAQQQGAMQAQAAAGATQQAQEQKGLDTAYQDYLTQLNYPYQQLSYMSNLIRGTPMGMNTQSQVYQAPGSTLGQLAGLGMMGYSASKAFADGGEVKGYAGNEGSVTSEGFEKSQLSRMSPDQLATVKHNALIRRDIGLAQLVDEVMAENRSLSGGLGGAFNMLAPEQQDNVVQAAGGGILAFSGKDRSDVPSQEEIDRAAMEDTLERMGAAAMDIGTMPVRGVTGALESAVTRPLRALGVPIPYLPDSWYGGNRSSATPYYDKIRARDEAVEKSKLDTVPYDAMTATRRSDYEPKKSTEKTGAKTPGVTTSPVANAQAKEATFADDMEMARKMLTNPRDAEDRKALNDLISQYGTRAGELKSQAFNDFLMNYGSALAQSAAQPGMGSGLQGALRSAAAAAPAGAKSLMDTRKAIAAAQDTNLKMQLEMRKYNIAESKNDRAAMVSAAQNIRMMRQQQAQLNETIRHNQASERLMGQRLSATGGAGLQKAYMAGISKAQDRASREATKLWGDMSSRLELQKQGIKTYDQLLEQRMKQHMKGAVPIYGVSAADDEDEG